MGKRYRATSALVDAEDGTGPVEPPSISQYAVFHTVRGAGECKEKEVWPLFLVCFFET